MNLRYVMRDGEKVLQFQEIIFRGAGNDLKIYPDYAWKDVPLVTVEVVGENDQ